MNLSYIYLQYDIKSICFVKRRCVIAIFLKDITRVASESELKDFSTFIERPSSNVQAMDFDESKLSSFRILKQLGDKEGQFVVIKSPVGLIEAQKYSQ